MQTEEVKKAKTSTLQLCANSIKFFVKVVFHFFDIITDILFVVFMFDRAADPKIPAFAQQAYFVTGLILVCALISERYMAFNFLIEIRQKQKRKHFKLQNNYYTQSRNAQQQMEYSEELNKYQQVTTLEKLALFFMTITHMEYIYFLFDFKEFQSQSFRRKFLRQEIIEFFTENYYFALCGFSVLGDDLFMTNSLDFNGIPFISSMFSILTCCYKCYQFQLEREVYINNKLSNEDIKFSDLTIETKLFILNPFKFQCIKEITPQFKLHKQLYVTSKQRQQIIQSNDNNINTNTNLSSKINNSNTINRRKSVSQNNLLNKEREISIFKKIYLMFYVTIVTSVTIIFIGFVSYQELAFYTYRAITYCLIIGFPQFSLYMILFLKEKRNGITVGQKIKELIKGIIFYPVYAYCLSMQLIFSATCENIPFFSDFKETWTHNFYPTIMQLVLRQIVLTVSYYGSHKFLDDKELVANWVHAMPDPQALIDSAARQDSKIRLVIDIASIGYIIVTTLHALYIVEIFYKKLFISTKPATLAEHMISGHQQSDPEQGFSFNNNPNSRQSFYSVKPNTQFRRDKGEHPVDKKIDEEVDIDYNNTQAKSATKRSSFHINSKRQLNQDQQSSPQQSSEKPSDIDLMREDLEHFQQFLYTVPQDNNITYNKVLDATQFKNPHSYMNSYVSNDQSFAQSKLK